MSPAISQHKDAIILCTARLENLPAAHKTAGLYGQNYSEKCKIYAMIFGAG